jgi:hypothetical protein
MRRRRAGACGCTGKAKEDDIKTFRRKTGTVRLEQFSVMCLEYSREAVIARFAGEKAVDQSVTESDARGRKTVAALILLSEQDSGQAF